MNAELPDLSAVETSQRIKARDISPTELMRAVLDRVDQLNPGLNAFITVDGKEALRRAGEMEKTLMRGEAKGILFGLPVSVKDNVFTKGLRTTNGSAGQRDFVPREDDRAVARIRSEGGIIFGKTNMPEFGCGAHGVNQTFGPSRNPWNPARSAGGSSGGAATAVAVGMGRLALGTDAGGSARIPAAFCGIYGFKPQQNRILDGPGLRPFRDLGHTCPMTFSVADNALFLDAVADHDPTAIQGPSTPPSFLASLRPEVKGLRVGFSADLGWAPVRPEIADACRNAVALLEEMGAIVEEASVDFSGCEKIFLTIARAEWHNRFGELVAEHPDQVSPGFAEIVRMGASISTPDYLKALQRRKEMHADMRRAFEKFDLLACPTVSVTAMEADAKEPEEVREGLPGWKQGWTLHSLPFSLVSLPAAGVPCGFDAQGLPMGLQLVGRPDKDQVVLNASAALEQAAPWPRPDMT